MALEDKKSGLQPSSVQAQQYRLQFTNLAPAGVVPDSITNRQPAPVTSPRSAVSAFQAPAVLTPASINTSPPSPSAAPANAVVYNSIAASLTGAGHFSTGTGLGYIAGAQDSGHVLSGSYAMSFAVKFDNLSAPHKQYIFHTYSGSFASQSMAIYIESSSLNLEYTNKGQSKKFFRQLGTLSTPIGNQNNGYTVITINRGPSATPAFPANFSKHSLYLGDKRIDFGEFGYQIGIDSTYDIRLNDRFNVGGTDLIGNQNFSGSIQYFQFYGQNLYTSQQIINMVNGTVPARTLPGQNRTWSFKGNGVEVNTGTQANDPGGLYFLTLTGSGHQSVTGYF